MTVFVVVFVDGLILIIGFRLLMGRALRKGAAILPVGTVKTYAYTGKSGALSEAVQQDGNGTAHKLDDCKFRGVNRMHEDVECIEKLR